MSKQQEAGALELARKIARWNYDKSVEKMRPLVKQWKKATVEMLRELYVAREFLTSQKGQYRDPEADDYLTLSWSGYCGEIGLSHQAANSLLRSARYIPRELSENGKDTLMLLNAPPKVDTAASRALMQARVAEVIRTGERPVNWSGEDEAEYARQMKNAEIARMAEKYNVPAVSKTKDYYAEVIGHTKGVVNFKLKDNAQKQAQFHVFRHIEAYLATFDDPETKSKAAFNLALKARNIANEIAEMYFNSSETENAK